MTTIALAFYLAAIPIPPSPIHTPHVPPANPQLALAPIPCATFHRYAKGANLVVYVNGVKIPKCK